MSYVKEMKLNEHGSLEITRGNEFKKLFCPTRKYFAKKTGRTESAFCEGACALFGEPEIKDGKVTIKLCLTEYTCDEENFTDERIQGLSDY